ncbi:MAG: addiction module protein [Candidatus Omnitrophica bacterium]|nr:addiction module protein [Candidatus Omnitrophota bacterium]MCK4422773.1 addiction module protein [Candidatus Omnitrophota bacterium]
MHGVKEIIREAESLPVEERAAVVTSLLCTLNPPDPNLDRKWVEVAKQRLEELRSARVKAVPGDQVFDKIRERFGG